MFIAAACVPWTGLVSIVVSMYATNRQAYALLLMIQIVTASVQLDRRIAIATIAMLVGFGIPLAIRAGGPDTRVYVAMLALGGYAAFVIHTTMRHALVRSEQDRAAAADAASKLTEQLAELQQANEERERLHDQLLHAQRMEAVGTLAAGIAHDMNNVLASIRSLGHLLVADVTDAKLRADIEQIIAQTERGAALTRGLLAFSRRGQYRKRVIRLDEVLRQVMPLLERTLPKSITVRNEVELIDTGIEADETQLEQVLINLALNAKDAMDGAGTLTIAARRRSRRAQGAHPRQRHRLRHGRGHSPACLRAVLHDEAAGQGHRARPLDGVGHRAVARRHGVGRVAAGSRHDVRDRAAALEGEADDLADARALRAGDRARHGAARRRRGGGALDLEAAARAHGARRRRRRERRRGARRIQQARGRHPARHPRHGHAGDGRRRVLPQDSASAATCRC